MRHIQIVLITIDQNIIQKLHFIDLVHRFGASYHFQQEIDQALEHIHITFTNDYTFDKDGDLHSLDVLFRLLKQQGFRISSSMYETLSLDKEKKYTVPI